MSNIWLILTESVREWSIQVTLSRYDQYFPNLENIWFSTTNRISNNPNYYSMLSNSNWDLIKEVFDYHNGKCSVSLELLSIDPPHQVKIQESGNGVGGNNFFLSMDKLKDIKFKKLVIDLSKAQINKHASLKRNDYSRAVPTILEQVLNLRYVKQLIIIVDDIGYSRIPKIVDNLDKGDICIEYILK